MNSPSYVFSRKVLKGEGVAAIGQLSGGAIVPWIV